MDRRGFFKLFGAGVAGIALEQAIPLGRVWSFPSKIVVPKRRIFGIDHDFLYDKQTVSVRPVEIFRVGSTISIRVPQRYLVRDAITKKDFVYFVPHSLQSYPRQRSLR